MTTHKLTVARLIGAMLLAAVGSAHRAAAQGTAADYARAAALQERYEAAAIDVAGPPTAIPGTHRFWYRKSVKGGHQFAAVDAETLQKSPAFDHEKVSAALSAATGRALTALKLPFTTIVFADDAGRSRRRSTVRRTDVQLEIRPAGKRNRARASARVSPSGAARAKTRRVCRRMGGGRRSSTISTSPSAR